MPKEFSSYWDALGCYLERNWEWLTPLPLREGMEDCRKGLGTCESNHRTYTYRMKKQGRRWSYRGGLAMVFVRVYVNTPGAGRAGPGGVGGITSTVVVPRVEHAGEIIWLPGP